MDSVCDASETNHVHNLHLSDSVSGFRLWRLRPITFTISISLTQSLDSVCDGSVTSHVHNLNLFDSVTGFRLWCLSETNHAHNLHLFDSVSGFRLWCLSDTNHVHNLHLFDSVSGFRLWRSDTYHVHNLHLSDSVSGFRLWRLWDQSRSQSTSLWLSLWIPSVTALRPITFTIYISLTQSLDSVCDHGGGSETNHAHNLHLFDSVSGFRLWCLSDTNHVHNLHLFDSVSGFRLWRSDTYHVHNLHLSDSVSGFRQWRLWHQSRSQSTSLWLSHGIPSVTALRPIAFTIYISLTQSLDSVCDGSETNHVHNLHLFDSVTGFRLWWLWHKSHSQSTSLWLSHWIPSVTALRPITFTIYNSLTQSLDSVFDGSDTSHVHNLHLFDYSVSGFRLWWLWDQSRSQSTTLWLSHWIPSVVALTPVTFTIYISLTTQSLDSVCDGSETNHVHNLHLFDSVSGFRLLWLWDQSLPQSTSLWLSHWIPSVVALRPVTFTIYISLTQSLDSVCDGSETNRVHNLHLFDSVAAFRLWRLWHLSRSQSTSLWLSRWIPSVTALTQITFTIYISLTQSLDSVCGGSETNHVHNLHLFDSVSGFRLWWLWHKSHSQSTSLWLSRWIPSVVALRPITFTIYISLTQSLDSVCDGSDTNHIHNLHLSDSVAGFRLWWLWDQSRSQSTSLWLSLWIPSVMALRPIAFTIYISLTQSLDSVCCGSDTYHVHNLHLSDSVSGFRLWWLWHQSRSQSTSLWLSHWIPSVVALQPITFTIYISLTRSLDSVCGGSETNHVHNLHLFDSVTGFRLLWLWDQSRSQSTSLWLSHWIPSVVALRPITFTIYISLTQSLDSVCCGSETNHVHNLHLFDSVTGFRLLWLWDQSRSQSTSLWLSHWILSMTALRPITFTIYISLTQSLDSVCGGSETNHVHNLHLFDSVTGFRLLWLWDQSRSQSTSLWLSHWILSMTALRPITFTIYISLTQSLDSVCGGSETNLIPIQKKTCSINSWPPRLRPWPSTKSALLAAAMICIINCLGVSLSGRLR